MGARALAFADAVQNLALALALARTRPHSPALACARAQPLLKYSRHCGIGASMAALATDSFTIGPDVHALMVR